jgi:hypothetical protein
MLDPKKAQLYKFLRRATAACGWLLYIYEWVHVSYSTPSKEAVSFAILLVVATLVIHLGVTAWIAHNKQLAIRGTRGRATRYTSPTFTHDHLGRQLFLDEHFLQSREIVISVEGNSKYYAAVAQAQS